ncbi:MAG: lectin like domain-containing protein [Propionibacteriaceae bacterium]|jgi:C1A family cysteine protease|nr:lectin like domain-containing protein [Propionibacteriaceae bacterium]
MSIHKLGVGVAALALALFGLPAAAVADSSANQLSHVKIAQQGSLSRTPIYATATPTLRVQASSSSLPTSYDMRVSEPEKVLAVRNQGSTGACWAFAATAVGSGSLAANGLASSAQSAALSPKHLVYAANGQLSFGFNDPMGTGGNASVTLGAWIDRLGPQSAVDYPFTNLTVSPSAEQLASSKWQLDAYQTFALPITSSGALVSSALNALKRQIMDVGPLAITLKSRGTDVLLTSGAADHMETVVGWDDAKVLSTANNQSSKTGAWLVQNSWGSTWGDSGYHWVSYYDRTVEAFDAYSLAAPDSEINFNYAQNADEAMVSDYDVPGTNFDYSVANVFTASSRTKIQKIGVTNWASQTTLLVRVYRTVVDNPNTGQLMQTLPLSNAPAGLTTVDVDDFTVAAGEKFAVVVSYPKNSGPYWEVERYYNSAMTNITGSGTPVYQVPAERQLKAGQSWYLEDEGWKDLYTDSLSGEIARGLGNVMLTAMGSPVSDGPAPSGPNDDGSITGTSAETGGGSGGTGGTTNPTDTTGTNSNTGGTTPTTPAQTTPAQTKKVSALRSTVTTVYLTSKAKWTWAVASYLGSERAGVKVTYKSSSKKVAVSAKGVLTAKTVKKKTKVTITATSGGVTKKLTVYVVPKKKSPGKVSVSRPNLKVGQAGFLVLNLGKATNPKVKLTSTNTKVFTVDKYGKMIAKKKGTATLQIAVNAKKYSLKITVK